MGGDGLGWYYGHPATTEESVSVPDPTPTPKVHLYPKHLKLNPSHLVTYVKSFTVPGQTTTPDVQPPVFFSLPSSRTPPSGRSDPLVTGVPPRLEAPREHLS